MASKIDKEIAQRAKKIHGDFEHRPKWCDNFWRIFFKHPATYFSLALFALAFFCFGFYQDWNWKNVIYLTFSNGITALITSLVQYFIFEKKIKATVRYFKNIVEYL